MATATPRRTRTTKPKAASQAAEDKRTDATLTEYTDEKGKKLTVQQLKNKLRGQAEREVLDRYKGEVVQITQGLYDQHGLEYNRRLTDEEKAAKDIADHINKYPQLAQLFAPAALAQLAKTQGIPLDPDNDHPEGEPTGATDAEMAAWEARKKHLAELAAAEGVQFADGVEAREGE